MHPARARVPVPDSDVERHLRQRELNRSDSARRVQSAVFSAMRASNDEIVSLKTHVCIAALRSDDECLEPALA